MKEFSDWTYQDAVDEIEARKVDRVTADGYAANRAIVEANDFWQDGKTWVGPRGTTEAWGNALKEAIAKQHVPGAASIEALSNFVRGLFGKEANIQLVPLKPLVEGSEEEKRSKQEAENLVAQLSAWWDRVNLWAKLRKAGARSRWATWGALRLWIPEGNLKRQGDALTLPTLGSLEEALAAVELSAPEPDHCLVLVHPKTQERGAIFHFVAEEGAAEDQRNRVELWYEFVGKTVLRILHQDGTAEGPFPYDWGGDLPVAEMEGELLLTPVVRRQEAGLDFAETNVVKVGETAGFRERYTTNAEPNGIWLTTLPTSSGPVRSHTDEIGRTTYFHALPRSLGPSVTSDLYGIVVKKDDDGEQRATPGITIADPVDPEFAIRGADYRRARVLQLCHQGHLAMTAKGEASGFAYEQARAAFRGDLEWHKSPAEQAIRLLLVALLRMAGSMASEAATILDRFRVVVTLTADPGPVSPEYRAQIMAEVKEGLLSRSSAMAALGVEDVDAELAAIDQDPEAQLGLLRRRVEVMTLLMGANPSLSTVQAAIASGWEEAEAKKLFSEADAAAVQDRQAREEITDELNNSDNDDLAA